MDVSYEIKTILNFSYTMATGSIEDRSLFKKFSFHYAVFDEGHLLKNMSSLRYQNLMRINVSKIELYREETSFCLCEKKCGSAVQWQHS